MDFGSEFVLVGDDGEEVEEVEEVEEAPPPLQNTYSKQLYYCLFKNI